MYLTEKSLLRIFLCFVALALLLTIIVGYFYHPSLMNKFRLNKTPSPEIAQMLKDYNSPQTAERYRELDDKAIKMAQSAPSLDITNCTPYPRVTKSNSTNLFKVTNSDEIDHTLTIDGRTFTIQGKSSAIIQFNFVETSDVLPYSCDNLDSFTGIFSITKEI